MDDGPSSLDAGVTRDAADPRKGSYSFITAYEPEDHSVQIREDVAGNVVGGVATITVSVRKEGSSAWVIVLVVVLAAAVTAVAGYLVWRYRRKIKGRSFKEVSGAK